VRVWRLKEEKTCVEYRCMVGDKVEEAKWKGLGVNDHWQRMKGMMMETAQDICGMTKGPRRHKETWWWNEEVAGIPNGCQTVCCKPTFDQDRELKIYLTETFL